MYAPAAPHLPNPAGVLCLLLALGVARANDKLHGTCSHGAWCEHVVGISTQNVERTVISRVSWPGESGRVVVIEAPQVSRRLREVTGYAEWLRTGIGDVRGGIVHGVSVGATTRVVGIGLRLPVAVGGIGWGIPHIGIGSAVQGRRPEDGLETGIGDGAATIDFPIETIGATDEHETCPAGLAAR